MKKIICSLLVAFIFVACGGNSAKQSDGRKCGEKRVGDIIMVDGELGIVYAVTTDGQHGKVMSVIEGECDWEAAKRWCAQYGRGWQMPSKDDLLVIYRKSDVLNSSLRANGYTKLNNWYWSSTEYSSDRACSVNMSIGSTYNGTKYDDGYVRAVSAF